MVDQKLSDQGHRPSLVEVERLETSEVVFLLRARSSALTPPAPSAVVVTLPSARRTGTSSDLPHWFLD